MTPFIAEDEILKEKVRNLTGILLVSIVFKTS